MENNVKNNLANLTNKAIFDRDIEQFKIYLKDGAWKLYDPKGNTFLHFLAIENLSLSWYEAFYETCGIERTILVLNKKNKEGKNVLDLLSVEPAKKINWSSLMDIDLDDYEKSLPVDSGYDDYENSTNEYNNDKEEIVEWLNGLLDN